MLLARVRVSREDDGLDATEDGDESGSKSDLLSSGGVNRRCGFWVRLGDPDAPGVPVPMVMLIGEEDVFAWASTEECEKGAIETGWMSARSVSGSKPRTGDVVRWFLLERIRVR